MKGLGFYGKDFFVIKKDYELVSESIIRIMMTNWNERVGRPFFGVNLRAKVFEQMDDEEVKDIEDSAKNQLNEYEPRATIKSFKIERNTDNNELRIKIGFKLIGDQLGNLYYIDQIIPLQ